MSYGFTNFAWSVNHDMGTNPGTLIYADLRAYNAICTNFDIIRDLRSGIDYGRWMNHSGRRQGAHQLGTDRKLVFYVGFTLKYVDAPPGLE